MFDCFIRVYQSSSNIGATNLVVFTYFILCLYKQKPHGHKSGGLHTDYTNCFHTLIIFLNCSSLMFMSSIGSRSGTPSGNRRITSCMDFPTLNRLSEDLRSLGRYNRMLLIFVMCLSSTGTTCK